jgi:hypothetical protein
MPVTFAPGRLRLATRLGGRSLRRQRCRGAAGYDHRYPAADEIGCKRGQPIEFILRPTVFDRHLAARLRGIGDEVDLDRPHQADHTQHRSIPSSASGALYSAREVPAGSPSNSPIT